jgi:hypothetical protein
MERRLFAIMTVGALLAVAFGIAMLILAPPYLQAGWLRAKLVLVAALIAYHATCYRLMSACAPGGARTRSAGCASTTRCRCSFGRDRRTGGGQTGLGPARPRQAPRPWSTATRCARAPPAPGTASHRA